MSALRRIFNRYYFSERVLFITLGLGVLSGGFVNGAYLRGDAEAFIRIIVGLYGVVAFGYSVFLRSTKKANRYLAYGAIFMLYGFGLFLVYHSRLNLDTALTLVGMYVICSLYFRTFQQQMIYLATALLASIIVCYLIQDPIIDPLIFTFRLFLGGSLILALSFNTRYYQGQLEEFSEKVAQENKALSASYSTLQEKLTQEQLLSIVAARSNAAVVITDADDRIEWVNSGFTDIFGYTSDEVLSQPVAILRGSKTDSDVLQRLAEKKKSGLPFREVLLNFTKSGAPVWIQMNVTPLYDDNGRLVRYIAIQEDVSEIKRTEQELVRSKDLLNQAQRQAKIGSWTMTFDSEFIDASDELYELLEINKTERLKLTRLLECMDDPDREQFQEQLSRIVAPGAFFEFDHRLHSANNVKYVIHTARVDALSDGEQILIGTIQDVTERRLIEQEVRLAEAQYRSLFEHAQHMICMHDMNGLIMSINPVGAHDLGYEPEELIGRSITYLIHEHVRSEFDVYLKKIVETGQAQGLLRLVHRNGTSTVWMYNNILLRDPKNQPFVLCSNVNITERYHMEQQLIQSRKTAEDALVTKDRFVANISHELRTPMNSIIGFAELLMRSIPEGEHRSYVKAIQTAGESLIHMINDLLDLAKIEAGKLEFEVRPYRVRDVLKRVHDLLLHRVADGKVVFKWMCGKDVPDYVLGDDHRLNQILMNVVGNALKFTEQGYVNVYCNIESETDEVIYLRYTIEDSGIGIPEDQLENIFEPFKQVSGEANRKYAGTGLGLTIVKDLVELQGGVVNVKSAPGLGTTFQIIIPAQRLKPDSVTTVPELLPLQIQNSTTKILLVEDHELNRQLAFRLISDFGFEVQVSHNGKDAIERLKNHRYDIILMDLQMPEVDGYAATAYIRERLNINTPIVAVTAHSAKGEREKCLQLGMNDYLTKPYRAQELYNVIVRNTQKEYEARNATTVQISDDQPLKALAAGDRKFELEILDLMIKGIPEDIDHLHHAYSVRDTENTRGVAHRLKSTFALAGLNALSEAAESIQIQAINSDEDWNSIGDHLTTIVNGQKDALRLLEEQRSGLL